MKKLILLILLIPSILFAGPLQQAHKKVIAGQTVAGDGADYSDIIFHYGMENSYDSDKPSLTASTQTMIFSDSYALAGTYSAIYNNSIYNKIQFSNTADAIFDRTEFRVGVWIRTGTTITDDRVHWEAYYDANNNIKLRNSGSTGLEILWVGDGSTYQVYNDTVITTETDYYVEVKYDGSTITLYIDGSLQSTSASGSYSALSASPANGLLSVGPNSLAVEDGNFYDQLIISNDSDRDINDIKTVTDFN